MNIDNLLWNNIDSLWINDNLVALIDAERKFLFNLFDIKEKIDWRLNDLDSAWLSTKKDDLYSNLSSGKEELFREFYLRYCTNRKLLEFSDKSDDWELLNKYIDVDWLVRLNIAKYIFLLVKKEQIFDVINDPLSFKEIVDIIKKFVYWFLWDLEDFISKQLNSSQHFDDFMKYYKNFIFNVILDSFNEFDGTVSLKKMLNIVSDNLFVAIDEKELLDAYINFTNQNFWELVDNNNLLTDDADDLFGSVAAFINKLIIDTNLDVPDWIDCNPTVLWVSGEDIADETWWFIKKYLWKNYNFKNLDANKFKELVCWVHLSDKEYLIWLKLFLWKLKLPVSIDSIPYKTISDSVNIQNYILSLKEKYPKAKNHLVFISNSVFKTRKVNFISQYKKSFSNLLESVLTNETFKSLSLVQLNTLMYYYLSVLQKCNFDVLSGFVEYVKVILEEKFRESHEKKVENEAQKSQRILHDKEKQLEKEEQSSKNLWTDKIVNSAKKVELPDWLIADLEKYFWWKVSPDLLRSLRNSFWEYKNSWYTKEKYWFDFDDWFFEILSKFWFVCIDSGYVNVESVNDWNLQVTEHDSWIENVVDENFENDDIKKLVGIFGALDSIENYDEKVDYYIKAFELFYDFRDKEYIKTQILDSVKHDDRVLKWIESIFYRILKGQREIVRKWGRTRKRYYRFDVGYNTWYRVVFNGQKWKSRKIIIDFVDHDTYENRIPSYYCKY